MVIFIDYLSIIYHVIYHFIQDFMTFNQLSDVCTTNLDQATLEVCMSFDFVGTWPKLLYTAIRAMVKYGLNVQIPAIAVCIQNIRIPHNLRTSQMFGTYTSNSVDK